MPALPHLHFFNDAGAALLPNSTWLRAGFLEPDSSPRLNSRSLSLFMPRIFILTRRGARGPASMIPVIVAVTLGAIALFLFACLLWIYHMRRKQARKAAVAPDLLSRPFPLEVKPGRSRVQPAVTTFPSPPAPVEIASPHRRRRRRQPVTPPAPIIPPPPPPSRQELDREHKLADRRERMRERAERRERERDQSERRRRSSTSKSILGVRWHLPPISEGYGFGLMTREHLDFRRLPSYHATDSPTLAPAS
ncbi:hypothetical protein C8F01DRAFT_1369931 [Mycena amicta]|nr:hypothetical protein C8F01DRAFT_1369931 [Mycena amicta]